MKQERAVVTRSRLLRAAAGELAGKGYAGASLQEVCRSAGVSMGALTFHFPAKRALAAAVAEAGAAEARALVGHAVAGSDPLASVARLTCELADLLARSPMARAAVRLENEGVPDAVRWTAAWEPGVRELLVQAREKGALAAGVGPETVLQLTVHLLRSAVVTLHTRPESDVADCLARIWHAVLDGLRAPAVGVRG